jgi:hypothetical protein
MPSDRSKISIAKAHLREIYANDLAGLKRYSAEVFAEATETVTLVNSSFEGGQGSGQITFEKILLLAAIRELIAEMEGTGRSGRRVIFSDYSRSAVST